MTLRDRWRATGTSPRNATDFWKFSPDARYGANSYLLHTLGLPSRALYPETLQIWIARRAQGKASLKIQLPGAPNPKGK